MRSELHDILVEGGKNAPVTGAGMAYGQWALLALGIIYGFIQIAYLLRKWWREESEAGVRMKRLLGKPVTGDTKPADL